MFDVLDNCLFDVFKMYGRLGAQLEALGLPAGRIDEADSVLPHGGRRSFDDVYAGLPWKYVIDRPAPCTI